MKAKGINFNVKFLNKKNIELCVFVSLWLMIVITASNAANDVVISQVMHGAAGEASKEFIELYNPTDTAIDLQNGYGLGLKFVNSSNSITNKNITWINSTIPARGYFLFVSSAYNDIGDSDAIFSYGLTSSAGVIIAMSGGSYIDRVGWGTGSDSAVETTAAPTFNTGQSIERKAGSIAGSDTDTNNNYEDFVITNNPVPRHSQSFKTPYYFVLQTNDTIYQYSNFQLQIICKDYTGETVTNFSDTVELTVDSGNIIETKTGNFSGGIYSGNHSINTIGENTIYAKHSVFPIVQGSLNISVFEGNYDTGIIFTEKENITNISDSINITLIDSDLNKDTNTAETVVLTIISNADTQGITVILKEKNSDTSEFDLQSNAILLSFTNGSSDNILKKIKVKASGDTITIEYIDNAPQTEITKNILFSGFQIKINEIMLDPVGTDQGQEWVELYNAGDESLDLTGWTLTDENAGVAMTMPELILPAKKFVVWYVDTNGTNETDFSDSVAHIYSGDSTTVSLTNTEDRISLYCGSEKNYSTIVDFIAYCADGNYEGQQYAQNAVNAGIWQNVNSFVDISAVGLNLAEGNSLRLLPDGNDNNLVSDYSKDITPTIGKNNNYIFPPNAPTNLTAQASYKIAVLNWTAASANDNPIAGYYIYRSQDEGYFSEYPLNNNLITGTTYNDTSVENDTVYFYKICAVDTGNLKSAYSNIAGCTPVSTTLGPDNIKITEIMYNPGGQEPQTEWVELYNPDDTPANIGGCKFGDGEGEYTIPANTVIFAKGYFVLAYSSAAAGGNYDLIYGGYSTGTISFANTNDQCIFKSSADDTLQFADYSNTWSGEEGNKDGSNLSLSRKYIDVKTTISI